jgi:predicted ArsR family transcriptional regulator
VRAVQAASAMTTRPLTPLQDNVLWIVKEHGPVTPDDVSYHLLISSACARGVLARLERRCLIDATYTEHRSAARAFIAR